MKGNLYEGCEEKINDRDIKGANKPGFDELMTDHFVTLSSIWKGGGNTITPPSSGPLLKKCESFANSVVGPGYSSSGGISDVIEPCRALRSNPRCKVAE